MMYFFNSLPPCCNNHSVRYLAVDMQLFIVCTFVVFVLRKSQKLGLAMWLAYFSASTVSLIAII